MRIYQGEPGHPSRLARDEWVRTAPEETSMSIARTVLGVLAALVAAALLPCDLDAGATPGKGTTHKGVNGRVVKVHRNKKHKSRGTITVRVRKHHKKHQGKSALSHLRHSKRGLRTVRVNEKTRILHVVKGKQQV